MTGRAFTLAEVLITLGIIGIVAAMTLPALLNNTRDKQYKAAFKKTFSAFSQAMEKVYMEEGGTYTTVNWKQMPKYFCRIQKEMKVLYSGMICPDNIDGMYFVDGSYDTSNVEDWPKSGKKYWHKDYEWFDKNGVSQRVNPAYQTLSFALNDGTLVLYNCTNQIFIDVNGFKKPNTIGKDIFYFILNNNSILPSFFNKNGYVRVNACTIDGSNSTPELTLDNYKEDCESGSGWGCSPLYIND